MSAKFKKGIDLQSNRATGAADASAGTDLATLQQVQALVRGLNWKASVRAATTTNGTLATAYANGQSIDGVTLTTGDRILLKNQTAGAENGIYTVAASGAPTRAVDADIDTELNGAAVYVTAGTTLHDTAWTQTVELPITVNTTTLTFSQFGGGTPITAGNGLTGTTTFSVLLDTASGLSVSSSGLKIDTAVVVRKFAADCVVTTNPQTFTHLLGTNDVTVTVWDVAGNEEVYPDVTKGSGTVIVDWGSAPTAAQYRVVVLG